MQDLRTRTAQGLFWSLMGNGTQQFVTLLIGVCLARILDVEDYALVAMLSVFGIIAGNLQESGFTSALAVKREARDEDFNAVFWFSIIVSLVSYSVLYGLTPYIADFNHSPRLTTLGRVLFVGFIISSFGTAHTAYLFRNLMVRHKTTSQVLASMLSGIIGLLVAIAGGGCWALVAMDLSYKFTYTLSVWHYSAWRPSTSIDLRPAFRMLGFSCKLLFTNIVTTLNTQLLQSILGHYLPAQSVGHYSQANKWNTLGCNLLTGAISAVAQPVLSSVGEDGDRQLRIFRKMLRFTALMSFPCMFGLALIAPEFIPLLIGSKWLQCVPYLQILAIGGAFIPINNVYSNLLISRKRSGRYMLSTCSFLACQMMWIVCTVTRGLTFLLLGIVMLTVLWLFVWHTLVGKEIGLRLRETLADVLPLALVATLSIGASGVCAWYLDMSLAGTLVLKVIIAVVTYCALVMLLRIDVFVECLSYVKSRIKK